jgi:ATP-binding cassette subfamily B protein
MTEALISFLRNHVLFSLLAEDTLGRLAQQLEMTSFGLREVILREGELGDCAYLVYSGKVRVFKQGPGGKPLVLATLGSGDLFGELSLLRGEARSASVRAAEDAVLFRIREADFKQLLHDQPELVPYLERLLRQRGVSNFLRLATFLGALPARQVVALLDRLQECRFAGGTPVVREGDPGDCLYIVKSGEARVVRGDAVLGYLGEGDYFGERGLMRREPRSASVIAVTDVEAYRLSQEDFAALLASAPQLHEQCTRRLEQYQRGAELAANAEVAPAPPVPSEPPVADLVWERLGDQPQRAPPHRRRRGWRGWLPFADRFPFLPQEDEADCGAAALAMIGRYHGGRLSVGRLRDLSHVGPAGASMIGLAQAAEAVGFRWRAVTTDFAHLAGLPLPAVAHWKGYHYVVLYDVRAARVVVGDPAVGLVTLPRQEFEAGWTGKLLLLDPTNRLQSQAPAGSGLGMRSPQLLVILLLSLLLSILPLALPVVTQLVVDRVLLAGETRLVLPLCGGLLAVGMVLAAVGLLRQRLLDRLARRLTEAASAGWLGRLWQLPLTQLQSRPVGAFLARLQGCGETRQTFGLALSAVLDLLLLTTGLAMTFCYHGGVGLATLLGFRYSSPGCSFPFAGGIVSSPTFGDSRSSLLRHWSRRWRPE